MALDYDFDYVNLGRSETLENLVAKRLGPLEKRAGIRNGNEVKVKVRFVVDTRSAFGNLKDSHVVIDVKVPGIPKLLVAKKKDADLRKAVTKAADTLLKEVRRYTDKQEHLRQH
jgi:ribosome-associated translation inhibitor RaiA